MNTHLIVSETNYFINEKLKELKSNIENIITFNMEENTLDEILEEASYLSMFNDEKCLIIKNATFFSSAKKNDTKKSKDESDKLLNYLEHENPYVKMIFILNGNADSKKKIYKILKDNNQVYTYAKLTKTDIKNELSKIVKDNKYQIDDKSLWYIINNSLGNLDIAINEINKIMLYYSKPVYIKYEDVVHLTSKVLDENNFKLVDSIIAKDLTNSLKYLEEAKILKIEPNVILALLYREFKLMLCILLYEENKYNHTSILQELKLADWQYEKVKNNLRLYKKWEIEEEIINLSDIDYNLKSGLINRDVVLLDYIINLC